MRNLLANYTRYNLWANTRVCDFLKSNLSEEQLDKEIISSFPSVRKTMLHIWDAEYIWLERLHGTSLGAFPSKTFTGNTAELYAGLLACSNNFVEYISKREQNYFLHTLHYSRMDGSKHESNIRDVVQHIMNHSTFHRGQIITMLRQLGFTELFATDYIAFCKV